MSALLSDVDDAKSMQRPSSAAAAADHEDPQALSNPSYGEAASAAAGAGVEPRVNAAVSEQLLIPPAELTSTSALLDQSSPESFLEPPLDRFGMGLEKWMALVKKAIMADYLDSRAEQERNEQRAVNEINKRYIDTMAGLTAQLRDAQELISLYKRRMEARNVSLDRACAVMTKKVALACVALAFSKWRVALQLKQSCQLADRVAAQKARTNIMRKAILGWQKAAGSTWRRATERKIQSEAEKAMKDMSLDYERRISELSSMLSASEARLAASEIDRARAHEEFKKALMRSVCSLNMDMINVFRSNEGQSHIATKENFSMGVQGIEELLNAGPPPAVPPRQSQTRNTSPLPMPSTAAPPLAAASSAAITSKSSVAPALSIATAIPPEKFARKGLLAGQPPLVTRHFPR